MYTSTPTNQMQHFWSIKVFPWFIFELEALRFQYLFSLTWRTFDVWEMWQGSWRGWSFPFSTRLCNSRFPASKPNVIKNLVYYWSCGFWRWMLLNWRHRHWWQRWFSPIMYNHILSLLFSPVCWLEWGIQSMLCNTHILNLLVAS